MATKRVDELEEKIKVQFAELEDRFPTNATLDDRFITMKEEIRNLFSTLENTMQKLMLMVESQSQATGQLPPEKTTGGSDAANGNNPKPEPSGTKTYGWGVEGSDGRGKGKKVRVEDLGETDLSGSDSEDKSHYDWYESHLMKPEKGEGWNEKPLRHTQSFDKSCQNRQRGIGIRANLHFGVPTLGVVAYGVVAWTKGVPTATNKLGVVAYGVVAWTQRVPTVTNIAVTNEEVGSSKGGVLLRSHIGQVYDWLVVYKPRCPLPLLAIFLE